MKKKYSSLNENANDSELNMHKLAVFPASAAAESL